MTSTRRLFKRLQRNPTIQNYEEFYIAINLKLQSFPRSMIPYLPRPSNFFSNDITNLIDQDIERFFSRPHEMTASFQESEDLISYEGKPLFSYRSKTGIVVMNPFLERLQVWSNVRPADYSKHVNGKQGYSQFYPGMRKTVELELFNGGKGYFDQRNSKNSQSFRIFLLKEFEENIGISKESKTPFAKLQVDRMRSSRGYISLIHGYPISREEFEKEIKDNL